MSKIKMKITLQISDHGVEGVSKRDENNLALFGVREKLRACILCYDRAGSAVEMWLVVIFFGLSMPVPYFISSIALFELRKVFGHGGGG